MMNNSNIKLVAFYMIAGAHMGIIIVELIMFAKMIINGGRIVLYEYNTGIIIIEVAVLVILALCDIAAICLLIRKLSHNKR